MNRLPLYVVFVFLGLLVFSSFFEKESLKISKVVKEPAKASGYTITNPLLVEKPEPGECRAIYFRSPKSEQNEFIGFMDFSNNSDFGTKVEISDELRKSGKYKIFVDASFEPDRGVYILRFEGGGELMYVPGEAQFFEPPRK